MRFEKRNVFYDKIYISIFSKRNRVFATNSDFLIQISLQPNVEDLRYFKQKYKFEISKVITMRLLRKFKNLAMTKALYLCLVLGEGAGVVRGVPRGVTKGVLATLISSILARGANLSSKSGGTTPIFSLE